MTKIIASLVVLMMMAGPLHLALAQDDSMKEFDKRLANMMQTVSINKTHAEVFKMPKRKFDSPVFCNEFIPWKNGVIINGLSVSPGGKTFDVAYRFFYFDTINKKLEKITCTLTDSIESLITWDDAVYLSGKKNGSCIIAKLDPSGVQVISTSIGSDSTNTIGKNSWVKLGIYHNQLLAFEKSGIFIYTGRHWQLILERPFAAVYYESKHKNRYPVIPTENIRISGSSLYFLQEITQQRSADLFSLDINKDSCAADFFSRNQLSDNSKKEIISYFVDEGRLWVNALRLMNDAILLNENKQSIRALVINNQLTSDQGEKVTMRPSAINKLDKDTIIFAGSDGLFLLVNNQITPVAYFSNATQAIKFKDGTSYDFEFIPRCIQRAGSGKFLIGGLWGGLYFIDISRRTLQCFDDLKKEPQKRDLFELVKSERLH